MFIQHLALFLSCSWSYREQFFTREYDVSCGFFIDALYWDEGVPFFLVWSVFLSRGGLDFVKWFSSVCSDNIVGFTLYAIHMISHINWFSDVKSILHFWDKSHLVIVYNPFYTLLNSICCCILRIFLSVLIRDIDLWYLLCRLFVWFW